MNPPNNKSAKSRQAAAAITIGRSQGSTPAGAAIPAVGAQCGDKRARVFPDAPDFLRDRIQLRLQFGLPAGSVPASVAEQHAQLKHLEHVGELLGLIALQQALQALEEHLPRDVASEQLLLERLSGPVGEDRVVEVQDGLVQESHHGKRGETHVFGRVAAAAGLLLRHVQQLAHVGPEDVGARHRLAVRPQTHNGRDRLLKAECKVLGSDGHEIFPMIPE